LLRFSINKFYSRFLFSKKQLKSEAQSASLRHFIWKLQKCLTFEAPCITLHYIALQCVSSTFNNTSGLLFVFQKAAQKWGKSTSLRYFIWKLQKHLTFEVLLNFYTRIDPTQRSRQVSIYICIIIFLSLAPYPIYKLDLLKKRRVVKFFKIKFFKNLMIFLSIQQQNIPNLYRSSFCTLSVPIDRYNRYIYQMLGTFKVHLIIHLFDL